MKVTELFLYNNEDGILLGSKLVSMVYNAHTCVYEVLGSPMPDYISVFIKKMDSPVPYHFSINSEGQGQVTLRHPL